MGAAEPALLVYQGAAGDRNERAWPGASVLGKALGLRLGLPQVVVGTPGQVLNGRWDKELAVALPSLAEMAQRLESVFSAGRASVSVITRCAVALATIPVVVRHHPDAVIVWSDAHADINTPDTTETGYLGGMALSGPLGWWPSRLGAALSPSNVILAGPRDIDAREQEHIDAGTITLIRGGPMFLQELDAAVGNRPVYFHLDCDVLDPGIVPTDFQVPGGLSLSDLHGLAQVLARSQVIGVEIAEFETPATQDDAGSADSALTGPLVDALMPVLQATAATR